MGCQGRGSSRRGNELRRKADRGRWAACLCGPGPFPVRMDSSRLRGEADTGTTVITVPVSGAGEDPRQGRLIKAYARPAPSRCALLYTSQTAPAPGYFLSIHCLLDKNDAGTRTYLLARTFPTSRARNVKSTVCALRTTPSRRCSGRSGAGLTVTGKSRRATSASLPHLHLFYFCIRST